MRAELDAVVIGSGPNGLAAAITVAEHGGSVLVVEGEHEVGGGLRTSHLLGPGLRHDLCSTIHTLGAGSPFMRSLPLERHGLEWVHPDVLLAHPLGGDRSALLMRSLDETVAGLGADGERYRSLVAPVVERWSRIEESVLGPVLAWPDHPLDLARFGLRSLVPATVTARRFRTPTAAALFAGCAAHSFLPLTRPLTTAFGLLLMAVGHLHGWPFARGGSTAFASALIAHLESLGGKVETGTHVTNLDQLPRSRVVLADVSPQGLARLLDGRVPHELLRPYRRFRHGPGAYKIDYALSAPVPWDDPDLSRAGTIHLGGGVADLVRTESATWAGRPSTRPFTLVCQPTVFDPSRSDDGRHALWVYAHVPHGSTVDFTTAIEDQITAHAPGFQDVILDKVIHRPADLERHNPNLVGGDIAGGAHSIGQLVFRPARRLDPYTTPLDRVFICSASSPPGGGTHGMCGHLAARSAIARWL